MWILGREGAATPDAETEAQADEAILGAVLKFGAENDNLVSTLKPLHLPF